MRTAAKINLSLLVSDRLDNGYHSLYSISTPVKLFNSAEFSSLVNNDFKCEVLLESPFSPEVIGNQPFIANSANQLMKFGQELIDNFSLPGIKMNIIREIPTACGLGGSSADMVNLIKFITNTYNIPLNKIRPLYLKYASDIDLLLAQKPCIIEGRGEISSYIDINSNYYVLLIFSKIGNITAEVFSKFDYMTQIKSNFFDSEDYSNTQLNIRQLNEGNNLINLQNNLFESALQLNSDMQNTYNLLSPLKPHMTGSGSAMFFINTSKNHLVKIQKQLPSSICSTIVEVIT